MTVPFRKYHGTGNDFIVVDEVDAERSGLAAFADRRTFAIAHCDRETGAESPGTGRRGADGVLFLGIDAESGSHSDPTRVTMSLVQPDGSTAAMCGNGARVVAAWAHDRTGETEFVIETPAGDRRAAVDANGRDVTIEMGIPRFDPADVPVDRSRADDPELRDGDPDAPLIETDVEGLTVSAVNTGVPHAVAFIEEDGDADAEAIDDIDLEAVAEPVRHADVFPEGANVNLAQRVSYTPDDGSADDREFDGLVPTYRQRTFERGVEGETRSCGTGAVAIAAVARRTGRVDAETVRSRPPGGELEITVPDEGPATLSGPVAEEGAGELAVDPEVDEAAAADATPAVDPGTGSGADTDGPDAADSNRNAEDDPR
ncbi:diaminopimelate epimerase [Halopenitus sp. POP-27]|uniref:diaminopimelate epimerase n=1 Tax=Halopenitus sp. POP-27 TaxID=2994425 RepID=UPI0024686CFF|nr:diaminopimelate epimerase [Halopenitus sp. POP-27]